MRKCWMPLATSFVLLVAGLVGAAPAFGVGIALPFSHYAAMAVDEAHGHLFFTAGSGGSDVWVTDLAGHLVSTIPSLDGATGLAMSADGSAVYVAEAGANAIAVIDTTSLAVTPLAGDIPCATWLAYTGGKLWYSYGCDSSTTAVAGFDPAGSPATATTLPSPGISYITPPRLSGGGPTATTLVVTIRQDMFSYDVSSLTETASNSSYCTGDYGSVAVSPDGATVAVACSSTPNVTVAKTSDFSQLGVYANGQGYAARGQEYPLGAAFSADGNFLALGLSLMIPNVLVYPLGDSSAPNFTASTNVADNFLVADDMRYGPSNDLYVVAPTSTARTAFTLIVFHDTTKFPSTTSISGPVNATRAQALSLTGHIAGPGPAIPAGEHVSVRRTDLSGTTVLPAATTAADGSFTLVDAPPVGGAVTYTAEWAGDGSHRASTGVVKVSVSRVVPVISISTNAHVYRYGGKATVTAHLGPTYNSRKITIYEVPYLSAKRLLKTATVDSHGNLTVVVTVYWRISFHASFAGDYRYAPVDVSKSVSVDGHLTSSVLNPYGHSGGYALYHHGTNVTQQAQLLPRWTNLCVNFRAEQYYSGAWHTVARSCFLTNGGAAAAVLEGTHSAGTLYRVRAEWGGNVAIGAATSSWVYFRFT